MNYKILLSCAFAMVASVQAQVPYLGSCPDIKTMDGFNQTNFMGKWYEAERYFSIFEFGGKCVDLNYSDGANNSIGVVNRQTSILTGVSSKAEGEVKKLNGESSKMNLRFPYLPMDAPYWILDTDYSNYSVIWSCSNFGFLSTRNAWILTRDRNPSLETMEKAYSVLDKNFISRAYFIRTDQKNCPEDF